MMQIASPSGVLYVGFSDEVFPMAPPDGSSLILLDTKDLWIARGGQWTFVQPLDIAMTIPLGGIPDAVLLPSSTGSGISPRQVVALGGNIAGQVMSSLESAVERIIDQHNLVLTELRVMNILLQGLNTLPVTDDLDSLRASALTLEESITR